MSTKKWKNRDALITAFDLLPEDAWTEVTSAMMTRSKFDDRAKQKGMARETGTDPQLIHVTNRAKHMIQAAYEALRLANKLGLNEKVSYLGMAGHDAGHAEGAHEGEQAMNIASELLDVGFFHHPAKGIDIFLSENLIEKMIYRLNQNDDKKFSKELKNAIWYVLDFVVSHDGEASKSDATKKNLNKKKYNSIKEAVLSKASRANRTNKYKCQAETLEGQLSMPADVLAYLRTDILDAFSQGIMTEFSDDMLELIGQTLSEDDESKTDEQEIRKDRINKAKDIITNIKRENLRESMDDIENKYDKEIIDLVENLLSKAEKNGVNVFSINEDDEEKIDQITENITKEYIEKQREKGVENNYIQADARKIKEYCKKMIITRKRVVDTVMTKVQYAFEDDYVNETLKKWNQIEIEEEEKLKEMGKDYEQLTDEEKKEIDEERYEKKKAAMGFSDKMMEILYGPKGFKFLDYTEYVQYTKKAYQTGCLPKATYELIKKCAEALVKTGAIRDKFYDRAIRDKIGNEEVLEAMKTPDRDEDEYDQFRLKIGIREPGTLKKARKRKEKYTKNKRMTPNQVKALKKAGIYKDIYNYTQRQGERFALSCEDVYYAIPYTIRSKVKKALDPDYKPNQYLPEDEKKMIYKIRRELSENFAEYDGMAITKENLEKYINDKIKEARDNLELKVATEISIKYLAGMSETRLKDLLIDTGILSKEEFEEQDVISGKPNENVLKLSRRLSGEESSKGIEEFEEKMKHHRVKPLFIIDDEDDKER